MQTHQWIGSVGHPGNGHDREELRRTKMAIQASLQAHDFPAERARFRLDGHEGSGGIVSHLADLSYVTRVKDSGMRDRADVQARFHLPADQHLSSAQSGMCRTRSDCPGQRLSPDGPLVRLIVATHPVLTTKKKKRTIGFIQDGVVSERFLTTLPQNAFPASDVVSLSLYRSAFETAHEDDDLEQEPDHWCSHAACG